MKQRFLAGLTILITVCGLAACASGFSKPLAYGYSTLTAINESTTESLQDGDITRDEAVEIANLSECIDGYLDSARRVWESGQEAQAQAELAIAIALISELQTYEGDWTDERCSP